MKIKKINLIYSMLVLGIIFIFFIGCGSKYPQTSETGKITISGSTSVGPLMEKLAEAYETKNSATKIEINQVGSSAGIKDTINNISEIGMSSRKLKTEEEKEVKGIIIAYDGIALITNKNNIIKNLNIEQIKGIYTGKITNWNEVEGGKDAPIVVVSREDGSGTRDAFQEIVGYKAEELNKDTMISNGNGGIKESVIRNENAVGFVSFEYLDDSVNVVNVEGVEPKAELVKGGEYKISRPFLLVTKEDKLTEKGQKLIDFILSEEGQRIILENKLIPIK